MPLLRQNVLASPGYTPGEQPADTSTNENLGPPSPRVLGAIRATNNLHRKINLSR